jgi:hypothetical protein
MGAQQLAQLCRRAELLKPEQINSNEMIKLVEEMNGVFEETLTGLRSALQTSPYQSNR